jgi:hypothetical protein
MSSDHCDQTAPLQMVTSVMPLSASRALYVKLGEKGCWFETARDTNTVRVGFSEVSEDTARAAATAGDFTPIKTLYEKAGYARGTATRFSNELREFYTTGTDVLWITFAEGRMWWCFAQPEVTPTAGGERKKEGSRYRKTVAPWSDKDLKGEVLWKTGLRGSLTTTEGFRGTICKVREFEYLLRRINGEKSSAVEAVSGARRRLIEALIPLIRGLHWRDFELLVELVVTQGGWRRVSQTGGTQHTTDIELELPFTGDRALVQVKSRLNQAVAEEVAARLTEQAGGAKVIIAYHTSDGRLSIDQDSVTLLGPEEIAEHVVESGLTTWVMERVG